MRVESGALFDPGLQPERTGLAWRRTGLSLIGCSLVLAKVLPEVLGPWLLIPGLIGVLVGIGLMVTGELRYRRHHLSLTAQPAEPVAGGSIPLLVSVVVVVLGLCGFGAVIGLALGVSA